MGCSIALTADLIVAGESAYFLQAFSRIGLVPDGGASWLVSRAVGRVRAMELMLLGNRLPAAQALKWGLINRVVPDEVLETTALELAQSLAKGPTRSLGMIRSLCWSAEESGLEQALTAERTAQAIAGRSPDAREGIAAFVQKRPPAFNAT